MSSSEKKPRNGTWQTVRLHALFGTVLPSNYVFDLESWFFAAEKISYKKNEENLSYKKRTTKMHFAHSTTFCRKKLIVPNLLTFETKRQLWQTKVACGELAVDWWLKITQVPQPATKFALKRARLRQTNKLNSAGMNQKHQTSQTICW